MLLHNELKNKLIMDINTLLLEMEEVNVQMSRYNSAPKDPSLCQNRLHHGKIWGLRKRDFCT